MQVLILGSGVIGVTSAWYLARAGHQVTVVDRQPGAGLETSFGNAGMISPGYSAPWAAPGVPFKAVKWMLAKHPPLSIRPTSDPHQYRWMVQMLANCTEARYAVNKERMMRLAEYSRDCLMDLRTDSGVDYEHREQGTLQVFRTQKQMDAAAKDIAVLERCGVPYEVLDRDGCVRAEPGLAAKAAELGVTFRYNCAIDELHSDGRQITGVRLQNGEVLTADRYVLALGSFSPKLARPLGFDLPIYPVKGYSLTLPVADDAMAPVSTIMDETYKVAVTRFADRIRVGGMAELTGFDDTLKEKRRATLEMVVSDLFPQGGKVAEATFWTGFRPMTPDGTPIIGASSLRNLYFNTGHGTLGWTMSCGSSKLLADLLSGEKPALNAGDYSFDRYSNHKEHQHHGHPASAH